MTLTTLATSAVSDALTRVADRLQVEPDLLDTLDISTYPLFVRPQLKDVRADEDIVEIAIEVFQDWSGAPVQRETWLYFDFMVSAGEVLVHGGLTIPGGISGPSAAAGDLARKVIEAAPELSEFKIVERVFALALFPGDEVVDLGAVRTVESVRTFAHEIGPQTEIGFIGGGSHLMEAHEQVKRVL